MSNQLGIQAYHLQQKRKLKHMADWRKPLATQAMQRAMHVRQSVKVSSLAPISIYKLIEDLNQKIEILFQAIPSTEGMYVKGKPPRIILPTERPIGRQNFTCAHELGHHLFNHGTRVDEVIEYGSNQPEEFLVDCFAGFLLMPKSAVNNAFTIRGWSAENPTPTQLYVIAGVLGVGYTTLINHMSTTINLLSVEKAATLRKVQPKAIRAEILGLSISEELVVVDEYWPAKDRLIEIERGDYVYLPPRIEIEGNVAELVASNDVATIFKGRRPGTGRLYNPETGWSTFIRVSKKGFVGWSEYRFMEDPDHD